MKKTNECVQGKARFIMVGGEKFKVVKTQTGNVILIEGKRQAEILTSCFS